VAKLSSWNPLDLLARLGVKDQGQTTLPLTESVQPTVGLFDASAMVPPVLPPFAWGGGNRTSAALNNTILRFTAGPRGAFLRHLTFTTGATLVYAWSFVAVATATTALIPLVLQNMSERGNVVSTAAFADILTANLLNFGIVPTLTALGSRILPFPDLIYLAPTSIFEVQQGTANQNMRAAFILQDAFGPEPIA